MSANVSSSSAFIISSSILNPILALGVFVYCDKTIVSSWTWTKLPLIKYTPFDIEKDAAVDVALFGIHEANDSPVGIKALFSGPETISLSANSNSPSAKT